jgi:hypothetical protein
LANNPSAYRSERPLYTFTAVVTFESVRERLVLPNLARKARRKPDHTKLVYIGMILQAVLMSASTVWQRTRVNFGIMSLLPTNDGSILNRIAIALHLPMEVGGCCR